MRQLLTWCATRAMEQLSAQTTGAQGGTEDKSARMAGKALPGQFPRNANVCSARVIQEELLKDFSNRSEMSDWFGREDEPQPKAREPLPERPNPKNEQNQKMIAELEGRIKRYVFFRFSLLREFLPKSPKTDHPVLPDSAPNASP